MDLDIKVCLNNKQSSFGHALHRQFLPYIEYILRNCTLQLLQQQFGSNIGSGSQPQKLFIFNGSNIKLIQKEIPYALDISLSVVIRIINVNQV